VIASPKVYVLDTNALLNDPQVVYAFSGAEVILPGVVLTELDALKHRREDRRLRYHGRKATRLLFEVTREGRLLDGVELPNGTLLRVDPEDQFAGAPPELDLRRADDQILALALQYDREVGRSATLVTNDLNMLLRAEALGLETYRFEGKLDQVATRRQSPMEWVRRRGLVALLVVLTVAFAATTAYLLVTRPSPASTPELTAADAGAALETLGATAQQLEQHYRGALAQNPQDVTAATKLGNLLFDQKRYLEAVDFYRKALEIQPKDANVRTDMGIALLYLGRYRESVEAFQLAIADAPENALAHYNLGVALAQGGDPKLAISELQKSLDLSAAGSGNVPTADAKALIDELKKKLAGG
jgi:Tfp pilus assembly protein PilF